MDDFYEALQRVMNNERLEFSGIQPTIRFDINYKDLPKELRPITKLVEPLVKANAQFHYGGLFRIHNANLIVDINRESPNLNVIIIPFHKSSSLIIGYFDRGNPDKDYFLMCPGYKYHNLTFSELKSTLVKALGKELVNLGHLDRATYSKKVQDTIGID